MHKELKMVHLQLTSRCNLKCSFCGQWGTNGFMKNGMPDDLSLSEWKKVVDSIRKYCINYDTLPYISLWGGEPLLYNDFEELVKYIHNQGFKIGVVTNGTLIDRHSITINKYVDTLYVSLDGPKKIHERCRGVTGIYDKITENVLRLNTNISDTNQKGPVHNVTAICLCTINRDNYGIIPDFPFILSEFKFSKVIFQNLMFFSAEDIKKQKKWLKECFNIDAVHVDSWLMDDHEDYIDNLPAMVRELKQNISEGKYPIEVALYPEELTEHTITQWYRDDNGLTMTPREHNYCYAPFQHLQITARGDVHFCVDFDDFSAGNVLTEDVMTIFNNDISEKFRREIINGKNIMCKRCPWRFNTSYKFD